MKKFRVTQGNMERQLLGVTFKDCKINTWIRQRTKVEDVVAKTVSFKWELKEEDEWSRKVI